MSKILIDEAVLRQALEALLSAPLDRSSIESRFFERRHHAIITLRQALADAALDKMADNARELGLTYDASVAQIDTSPERVEKEAAIKHIPTPPECKTEAEKTAFAFGWFKALESVREQPAPAQPDHCEDILDMVEQPAQQQEARIAQLEIELMKKQGRELKLQFAPAQQDIPDLIAGALGVSRGTAYDMMREALAEQSAQQEPVGYWQGKFSKDGGATLCRVPQVSFLGRHTYPNIPLYSTPPAPAQPLTDEEIQKLRHNIDWTASWSYIDFARAIEQAHGITKGGAA